MLRADPQRKKKTPRSIVSVERAENLSREKKETPYSKISVKRAESLPIEKKFLVQ